MSFGLRVACMKLADFFFLWSQIFRDIIGFDKQIFIISS